MSERAKRGRTNFNGIHHPVVDFWRREVGGISSRNFSNRFSASEIYRKLVKHKGCVNTASFNAEGDLQCQMTGKDKYENNEVETEYEAYAHTRENEDLESAQETYCRDEDGKVEVNGKTSLVREMIGEEREATEMASDQEGEDIQEVFIEAGWAQGLAEIDEIKEHADSRVEMLGYDRSETDSNISGEKFEQTQELADETKIDASIDTDTSRSSFKMRQGDSYIEEVGIEQDLSDQFHEKDSVASSTEEYVEEIDSDSIQSGWSVVDDDEKIKSYGEEILADRLQDGEVEPEEMEETKEETDTTKTSFGEESNEDKTEQAHQFECQKEERDRSSTEPAESSCCLPKGDEILGHSKQRKE